MYIFFQVYPNPSNSSILPPLFNPLKIDETAAMFAILESMCLSRHLKDPLGLVLRGFGAQFRWRPCNAQDRPHEIPVAGNQGSWAKEIMFAVLVPGHMIRGSARALRTHLLAIVRCAIPGGDRGLCACDLQKWAPAPNGQPGKLCPTHDRPSRILRTDDGWCRDVLE